MDSKIEYRSYPLAENITAFIIKKSDLTSKEKRIKDQIEALFTGRDNTIIHGNTYAQRNGYNELTKDLVWDKTTEKLFIVRTH